MLKRFEKIARMSNALGNAPSESISASHPFDERDIHPDIRRISIKLFDDGHYSQATFEAFKLIDLNVKKYSKLNETGFKLMMSAFSESNPKIKLTDLSSQSKIDEQLGYKYIFAGAMSAIRNPRGHEISTDPISTCLDHLSFASLLMRRLDSIVP